MQNNRLEIWAIGYNKDQEATDYEFLIFEVDGDSFLKREMMINFLNQYVQSLKDNKISLNAPKDVEYVEIVLEYVKKTNTEEGEEFYECFDILKSEVYEIPKPKKVYALTRCSAEKNYTPELYLDKKEVLKRVKEMHEEIIAVSKDAILVDSFYDSGARIIYTDDTCDRIQTFELEAK